MQKAGMPPYVRFNPRARAGRDPNIKSTGSR